MIDIHSTLSTKQVDLGAVSTVTGIATQGMHGSQRWVTSYFIQYSNNCRRFATYRENGRTRVGNGCFFGPLLVDCWEHKFFARQFGISLCHLFIYSLIHSVIHLFFFKSLSVLIRLLLSLLVHLLVYSLVCLLIIFIFLFSYYIYLISC